MDKHQAAHDRTNSAALRDQLSRLGDSERAQVSARLWERGLILTTDLQIVRLFEPTDPLPRYEKRPSWLDRRSRFPDWLIAAIVGSALGATLFFNI